MLQSSKVRSTPLSEEPLSVFQAAKMIAAARIKEPGLLDVLRRWVEDKYKLPWTHEAIQDQTLLELLTSYWEDYYEDHRLEAQRDSKGEVTFSTGDPYIDKWERELAMGLEPDLLEDLPSWHREGSKPKQQEEDTDGFNEDYRRIASDEVSNAVSSR